MRPPRPPASMTFGASVLLVSGALLVGCSANRPPQTAVAEPLHEAGPRTIYEATAVLSSPGDRWAGFDPANLFAVRAQAFQAPVEPADALYERRWSWRGPSNYAGKVMGLAVSAAAPNTIYAAYGSAGVWKSVDSGDKWKRVTSTESANYTSAVAASPSDGSTVFVGLGAPGYNLELERGVLRSTDGGKSWEAIGPDSPRADAIFKIVVDPADDGHLILATEEAVFVTTDGGGSWIEALAYPGHNENWWDYIPDLVGHPTDGDVAWLAHRNLGVYRTADGGATWTRCKGIKTGHPIVLAVSASDPKRLYAEQEGARWPEVLVYRSDNGGVKWTKRAVVDDFYQGRYDMAISVDPANRDRVVIANTYLRETLDGGKTWVWPSQPHPDHLALAWRPGDASTYFSGNDGGVWRSRDAGRSWKKVDQGVRANLSFNLGVAPGGKRLYLTSGDWIQGQTTAGTLNWSDFPGYEWQFYEVDPHDPGTVYTSTGTSRLLRVENNGAKKTDVDPCPGQGGRYDRTIDFDPIKAGVVYAPCLDLRKSTNRGDTWKSISPELSENPGWFLSDFEVAPSDPDVIWVMTEKLWHTRDGGKTWESRSLPAYPQDLAVDPTDPSVVVVASAFEVFRRYSQWGEVEENLWGNLPRTGIRRIQIDPARPQRIFVATDIGVFVSPDEDGVWYKLGKGLPRILFWDLDLEGTKLFASGQQGVWRYDFTER